MAPSGWPKQEFESVSRSQRRKMPRSVKMDFAEGAEERPAMVSEVQWSSRDLRSSSMNLLDGERSCVRRRLIITVWLKMATLEVNRGVLEVWQRISNFCPAGPESPQSRRSDLKRGVGLKRSAAGRPSEFGRTTLNTRICCFGVSLLSAMFLKYYL